MNRRPTAELLDTWKKVENAVVSVASVGLAVDNEAAVEAQAVVAAAQSLLREMFPTVLTTVRNEDEDVRLSVIPFLQAYANKLRSTAKRLGSLPEVRSRPQVWSCSSRPPTRTGWGESIAPLCRHTCSR